MSTLDLSDHFDGTDDEIYFDVAVRGLLPVATRDSIREYVDARVTGAGSKQDQWAQVERSRSEFAELIGASPDEIAIIKNVTEGLNLFAASLNWYLGDNVVICPELEHPCNVFLWYNLQAMHGIEIRAASSDGGRVPVERLAELIDDRTRVVTVPHMTFSPGFITPVEALADAAHRVGAHLLVDAAQSAGAIETDVKAAGIDALAAATQKSLLALYGYGFLYVRAEVADQLTPRSVGRYGMDLGDDAHETAITTGELSYRKGARRYDLGNFNYLGGAAAATSLELIRSIGPGAVESHLRGLTSQLANGLLELGLPVAGGRPGPHLGHIVAVGESGGGRHYSAEDPAMNDLHEHLTRHGVRLSIRRGILRMSLGIYNTAEEVDRVLELVRDWTEARSAQLGS